MPIDSGMLQASWGSLQSYDMKYDNRKGEFCKFAIDYGSRREQPETI